MGEISKKNQLPGFFASWPFSSRFFDDMSVPVFNKEVGMDTIPSVNIKERKNDYSLAFAAPGLNKEDFEIHVENGVLTVACEKRMSEHETDDDFTRKEFQYSSFKRSFKLPDNCKEEDVNANYKDGILEIFIPKKVDTDETKRKKVNVD